MFDGLGLNTRPSGVYEAGVLDVLGEALENLMDALTCFDGSRACDVGNQVATICGPVAKVLVAARQGRLAHAGIVASQGRPLVRSA